MSTISYKVEVIADDSGKWVGNALRFATRDEASCYASDLYSRWTAVSQKRVVQSDDPVGYTWDYEEQRAKPLPVPY